MRLNLKKIFLVCGVVVCISMLTWYSSQQETSQPRPKNRVAEIEARIQKLEQNMHNQLVDSENLLMKIRNKKNDNKVESKEKEEEQNEQVNADYENTDFSTLDIDNLDLNQLDGPLFSHNKISGITTDRSSLVLPVLVIACDRVTVRRCIDNLIKFRPDKDTFPIIISQDCGHNATYNVIRSYTDADPTISIVRQPDLSEIPLPRAKVKFRGYYKIARHFKFALNYVFRELGHEAVIIVEDDLDISPDFFEYFLGTYPLLHKDPSLWCISAWNDNGKKEVIDLSRPELLHRTDFFPGLGWLLRADTWFQLDPVWPPAFFDDWLRNPDNVDHKACIRPEISRTYSFGKIGVSKGLFFDMHLRNIQLNQNFVEFTKLNLSYLLKENYDENLLQTVASLPEMTANEVILAGPGAGPDPVRVTYSNAITYRRHAKKLGLMDDFRSGVPRTAYRGIVTCYVHGRRVYLTPDYPWTKYDPSWG